MLNDADRPTIGLAREIAGWDQGGPETTSIPHWAVNLAAHLVDAGYRRLKSSTADGWRHRKPVYCRAEQIEAIS